MTSVCEGLRRQTGVCVEHACSTVAHLQERLERMHVHTGACVPRDRVKSNQIHSWSHGLRASLISGDEDDEDDDDLDGPTGKRAADDDDDEEEVRTVERHTHRQAPTGRDASRVQSGGCVYVCSSTAGGRVAVLKRCVQDRFI